MKLRRLYKVRTFWADTIGDLQAVLVSASNKREAADRALAFIATQYPERVRVEATDFICRTPDDVLDWA